MDLNKIIKIEKGGSTTTLPPFKESVPNIQVQKVVQPTVINSLNYSTDKVLQGIIKKVEKQEIPAKQSPVVVFSGELNKKPTWWHLVANDTEYSLCTDAEKEEWINTHKEDYPELFEEIEDKYSNSEFKSVRWIQR